MKYRVIEAKKEDVFKNIARVPEEYRLNEKGERIPAGRVCYVKTPEKKAVFVLRGITSEKDEGAKILLDEQGRERLGLKTKDSVELVFKKAGFVGEWLWAWSAADTGYRVAVRVSMISFLLGVISLIISLLGFFR